MLEGCRTSGGLKGDFLKKSVEPEASPSLDLNQACSVRDEEFQFQGLRHTVTGRQLVEAKLLDMRTVEQLRLGLKTVEEVQRSLSKFLTKATSIAGLYLESSKEKNVVHFGGPENHNRQNDSSSLFRSSGCNRFYN